MVGDKSLWKIGGASRDRTDDLIVANSQTSARWRDTEEVWMAWKGSVHAGLGRCSLPFMWYGPTPGNTARPG